VTIADTKSRAQFCAELANHANDLIVAQLR
jgi:hypothetical protein